MIETIKAILTIHKSLLTLTILTVQMFGLYYMHQQSKYLKKRGFNIINLAKIEKKKIHTDTLVFKIGIYLVLTHIVLLFLGSFDPWSILWVGLSISWYATYNYNKRTLDSKTDSRLVKLFPNFKELIKGYFRGCVFEIKSDLIWVKNRLIGIKKMFILGYKKGESWMKNF